MKEHTLFGNKIPKSKARTGEFLFKHYAKNGFDPSNPPKLSAVPSEKDFDDFGILHIVEDQKASLTSTGNFADVNGPTPPSIQRMPSLSVQSAWDLGIVVWLWQLPPLLGTRA